MERISILEAARQIGRSKSTVKYWVQQLPAGSIERDDRGQIWLTAAGLDALRKRAGGQPVESLTGQGFDRSKTGQFDRSKSSKNGQEISGNNEKRPEKAIKKPNQGEPVESGQTVDSLTGQAVESGQGLTGQTDSNRAEVAEAERRRADAAERQCAAKDRQIEAMQTQLAALTAALEASQRQAAALADALQSTQAALTAAQALHAGTLRRQLDTTATAAAQPPQAPPVNAAEAGTVRNSTQHTAAAKPSRTQTRTQIGSSRTQSDGRQPKQHKRRGGLLDLIKRGGR